MYNVVGRIRGVSTPDEWVIFGNHHDGWVNGAADPISGASALMEAARALSQLTKSGWQPQRTIIFTLWDGEEWGLLGSTEWAEEHAQELRENAVVYLNTDGYSKGVFDADGSHTLTTFVREIARDMIDPAGGNLIEAAQRERLTRAKTAADSAKARNGGFELGAPGSGTDFQAFLEHLGIASVSHGFSGGPTAGTYHSIYDSYDNFRRFIDPGFVYGKAQAATVATLALRMADAPLLPFSFSDAATAYRGYAQDVVALAQTSLGSEKLDVSPVMQAIDRLAQAGADVDRAYDGAMQRGSAFIRGRPDAVRAINRELYQSERDCWTPTASLDASGSRARCTRRGSTPASPRTRCQALGRCCRQNGSTRRRIRCVASPRRWIAWRSARRALQLRCSNSPADAAFASFQAS